MATVSVTLPSDGQTIDASDVNTPINTIVNEINGSLDADNIANGSITNAKLDTTAGELGGAWQDWTPTWSNFTTGDGTLNYANYIQIGKTVHFRLKFTLGSTSSVSGVIQFTLPVSANSDYATNLLDKIGIAVARDNSPAVSYDCNLVWATGQEAALRAKDASGTYLSEFPTGSTVPMTWATSDTIYAIGTYEAA